MAHKCEVCGREFEIDFKVPARIWTEVTYYIYDFVCPDCFQKMATDRGIELLWECSSVQEGKPNRWIPVEEKLPHDTWLGSSDTVLVILLFPNGIRIVDRGTYSTEKGAWIINVYL